MISSFTTCISFTGPFHFISAPPIILRDLGIQGGEGFILVHFQRGFFQNPKGSVYLEIESKGTFLESEGVLY